MIRMGEVVQSGGGMLTVAFERLQACENCGACMGGQCAASIDIPGEAAVGDWVDVQMPEKRVLQASVIMYVVPLALLIAGLLLGEPLRGLLGIPWSTNLFAALTGGVLLIVGLLIVYGVDRHLRKKRQWQPRIVGVHAGGRPMMQDEMNKEE